MEAAGAYLQTLREGMKLSRAKLAEQLGTTENTLWRIEAGRQEPGGALLFGLIKQLRGAYDDVARLLEHDVPLAEAQALARQRVAEPPAPRLTPSEQRLLEALQRNDIDPDALAEIVATLRRRAGQE